MPFRSSSSTSSHVLAPFQYFSILLTGTFPSPEDWNHRQHRLSLGTICELWLGAAGSGRLARHAGGGQTSTWHNWYCTENRVSSTQRLTEPLIPVFWPPILDVSVKTTIYREG